MLQALHIADHFLALDLEPFHQLAIVLGVRLLLLLLLKFNQLLRVLIQLIKILVLLLVHLPHLRLVRQLLPLEVRHALQRRVDLHLVDRIICDSGKVLLLRHFDLDHLAILHNLNDLVLRGIRWVHSAWLSIKLYFDVIRRPGLRSWRLHNRLRGVDVVDVANGVLARLVELGALKLLPIVDDEAELVAILYLQRHLEALT